MHTTEKVHDLEKRALELNKKLDVYKKENY